jgi:hypothetical protein
VLLDHPNLQVLGIPFDQLFLMKLNASRAVDTDDMEVVWSYCTFGTPEAAVEAFYRAYPLERHDEFLADHIRTSCSDRPLARASGLVDLDSASNLVAKFDRPVDNLLWESDFPHMDSLWPHSRTFLEKTLADVPDDDARKIGELNARRVFSA